MDSTNARDRVRRNETMATFCDPPRNMLYKPVNHLKQIDATLWYEQNPEKICGLARIVSVPVKFGVKPMLEVEKEIIDFLFELSLLCKIASAVIFRFRDGKLYYWRIENPNALKYENSMKRGKSYTTYQLPIQNLKAI